jgi:adenosylmethionine---8-amino-7-oxononanoate aminotransferase
MIYPGFDNHFTGIVASATFENMGLSLSERDKQVIWHPYTPQKYAPEPIPVTKGEGSLIFDDKGNAYIDAISSWWVTIHGHAHPYIAQKIYEQALQLEQVIFAGFTHEPAVQLAERLLKILPGELSKIFYSDNGSTATEVAVKMAIQYWWNKGHISRNKIIALTNSYHGDTFGAMSISERGIFTKAFQDKLFDVLFVDVHDFNIDANILKECACIIYEPLIQGAGGMQMYSPSLLENMLRKCKEHDIICIADEVMTGFGRTGKLFASSYCAIPPDIICLSKGITGGTMALGATACNKKIHDVFVDEDKLKTFFHGHSFTANPIACAAALASLDLLLAEESLNNIARIVKQHELFVQLLTTKKDLPVINVRQQGTIIAFEVNDSSNNYISNIKEIFIEGSIKNGVYLRPLGNTVYIMPPYCMSNAELQKVYAVIIEILSSVKMKQELQPASDPTQ